MRTWKGKAERRREEERGQEAEIEIRFPVDRYNPAGAVGFVNGPERASRSRHSRRNERYRDGERDSVHRGRRKVDGSETGKEGRRGRGRNGWMDRSIVRFRRRPDNAITNYEPFKGVSAKTDQSATHCSAGPIRSCLP